MIKYNISLPDHLAKYLEKKPGTSISKKICNLLEEHILLDKFTESELGSLSELQQFAVYLERHSRLPELANQIKGFANFKDLVVAEILENIRIERQFND